MEYADMDYRMDVANAGLTQQVVVALRRIIRAIELRSRFLVSHYGLTGPQLALLRELAEHEGLSVGKLTGWLHLSQATVTGILDRLVKRGWVRRRRDSDDRRRVKVWLTDAGRQLLADAPSLLQEEFIQQLERLDRREQEQILSALQRVVTMMEAKDIQAAALLTTGPAGATSEHTKAFLGHEGGQAHPGQAREVPIEPSEPADSET